MKDAKMYDDLGAANLLGNISTATIEVMDKDHPTKTAHIFDVVNAYTQYNPGRNLSTAALEAALFKVNKKYKGLRVGLPQIGCGIAGGDWDAVSRIIERILTDVDYTIVLWDPSKQYSL